MKRRKPLRHGIVRILESSDVILTNVMSAVPITIRPVVHSQVSLSKTAYGDVFMFVDLGMTRAWTCRITRKNSIIQKLRRMSIQLCGHLTTCRQRHQPQRHLHSYLMSTQCQTMITSGRYSTTVISPDLLADNRSQD